MKNGKICHFWAESRLSIGTKQGWYRYHLCITKMIPVPRQSGTGTTHQNRIGTITDPSGTGTTASCNLDFGILTLLSSISNTEGIGTQLND